MGAENWKKMFDRIWKREGNSFIQFLLEAGLGINTLNMYGTTMLSYASECGNLEVVGFLVLRGADINAANADGSRPLHIAVQHGRKDILNFFYNRRLSVDFCDEEKRTPLHYVAAKWDVSSSMESFQDIVYFLLDRNADLDAVDRKGCTPLLLAAQKSRMHVVQFFMKLGANHEYCDEKQWNVFHYACREGWSGIIQTLVKGKFDIDLNLKTSEGFSPVIIAAYSSHKHIVEQLVESGAGIEGRGFEDQTVLHYACNEGWSDTVKLLVCKGCDLNAEDTNGFTPLICAAFSLHSSIAEYLIECGADVGVAEKEEGCTALHCAAFRGSLHMVKMLVSKGCDLNAKDFCGNTPMLRAAAVLNSSVVKYLLNCGAEVKDCNKDGWTLLHYACKLGWLEIVKTLVSKGCDLNARDKEGCTPLLAAASSICWVQTPYSDVIGYLVECEADLQCCNRNKMTLLHFVCENGWFENAKSLIEKGCDVNAQCVNRYTPLHLAARSGNLETVKHLLSSGADCNVESIRNETAFNMSIRNFLSWEVIVLFLRNGAYFHADDYAIISKNSLLKQGILQNTQHCTLALINKFNNHDLCKIYEIPGVSKRLPSIEKLKITSQSNVARNIAESVNYEIETKGYCNVLNVCPIVLNRLCVLTLVKPYYS